jgi:chloramphenicol 3-O-phosphotransferase
VDAFLDMLPKKMLAHPDGLAFKAARDHGKPITAVKSGPVLRRAMRGMRHAVAEITSLLMWS